jgi:serine/threonine-protein kinase RsbT
LARFSGKRQVWDQHDFKMIQNHSQWDSAAPFGDEAQTEIRSAEDVLTARSLGRLCAIAAGFAGPEVSLLTAAISEVARNIVEHAKAGSVVVRLIDRDGRKGLRIIAVDHGPGIPDVELATEFGLSPRVGLPGAKLLVDEFEIISSARGGTTITMTKWVSR